MHIQKCFRRRSVTNLVTEFVTFYFDKWKYDFFLFSNHQYVKNYINIDILFICNKELRAILFFVFLYRDNLIQFWLASVLRNLNIFFILKKNMWAEQLSTCFCISFGNWEIFQVCQTTFSYQWSFQA